MLEHMLENNYSGALIVAMTPVVVYSYLPCTTEKPLIRFGLSHKTITVIVNAGLIAAGLMLGLAGFVMSQQSGLPVFHTNLTLIGAGIPLLLLLVIGKSSHVDGEDEALAVASTRAAEVPLQTFEWAASDEQGAKQQKAGDNALQAKSSLAPIIAKLVEFKKQNAEQQNPKHSSANDDVEAWLCTNGLTPTATYAHALKTLGACIVDDVVHHVDLSDLQGVLQAVPRNKLWSAIERARKTTKAAGTQGAHPKTE